MLPRMIPQTVSNPIVSALSIASIFEIRYEDNLLSPIVISHLFFSNKSYPSLSRGSSRNGFSFFLIRSF